MLIKHDKDVGFGKSYGGRPFTSLKKTYQNRQRKLKIELITNILNAAFNCTLRRVIQFGGYNILTFFLKVSPLFESKEQLI